VRGCVNVELTPAECGLLAEWMDLVLRGWVALNSHTPSLERTGLIMTLAAGGYDRDLLAAMRRRAGRAGSRALTVKLSKRQASVAGWLLLGLVASDARAWRLAQGIDSLATMAGLGQKLVIASSGKRGKRSVVPTERVRQLLDAGFTQEQVAARLEIDVTTLRRARKRRLRSLLPQFSD
jgi:hypothetical protein